MNIDQVYRFINFIANKKQYGNITPENFNLIIPQAQISAVMKAYGNPKTYENGRPIPVIGYSMTTKTQDDLRPLLKYDDNRGNGGRASIVLTNVLNTGWVAGENMQGGLSSAEGVINKVIGALPDITVEYTPSTDEVFQVGELISIEGDAGVGTVVSEPTGLGYITVKNLVGYPSDYLHIDNIERIDGTSIAHLSTSEIGKRRKSLIKSPATEYPIHGVYSDNIRIYPDLTDVILVYVRLPINPVWAYTLTGTNPVYDSANSIQLELPADMHTEICMLALQHIGINLSHAELTQYSMAQETQGI